MWTKLIATIRGPVVAGRRWRHTVAELLEAPFRAPVSTRQSRLSRKAMHEVTIYLGDDATIYVQHLSLTGKGQAEVAIRMCWEAMQHLAMQSGLALNLPAQAAVPVTLTPLPQPEPVAVQTENGSH